MAITAGGIGSGLDVEGLVSQLVAAEGQPALLRLGTKEARLQADLSAYGTLKSALSTFQDSVQALNDLESFQARKATSSNVDLFSATADTTAVAASYDIEVLQLAEAEKRRSGDFATDATVVGTGTLDISLGTDTFQLTIDGTNNTLAGIRDAINAASDNPGVAASIINVDDGVGGTVARLVLTGDTVGATNTIGIVVDDDDLSDADTSGLSQLATANLTTLQAAQDAKIEVDGQAATRGSNSFSDIITGVSFSLTKAEVGTVETLTIDLNKDSVTAKVNSFVSNYNSLIDTINALSAYDADTGAAGALLGDSALRSVQSQLRQTITASVSGLDLGTLAEIGVTTDENGKLTVDSTALDEVMTSDFTTVSQLFASDTGLANTLDTLLERYVASDGILTARTDGLQISIDSITDDRERLNDRLAVIEARYRAQFNAMDLLVGQLQALGGYLTQQLASLPKPNSINSN